jgi:hypothetical protein
MAFRSSLDLSRHSGPKRNIPVGGVSLGAGDGTQGTPGQSLSSFGNFSDFNDRISGEIERRQKNLAFNKFEQDEDFRYDNKTMDRAEKFAADQAAKQKRNSIFGLVGSLAAPALDVFAPGVGKALAGIAGASKMG